MRKIINLLMLCALVALFGCYNPPASSTDRWDMSAKSRDSVLFLNKHHYTFNYNFDVVADTLVLQVQPPLEDVAPAFTDSVSVFRGDQLVVADILTMPADSVDSVWIKVARDQLTMGWVHESRLLPAVVPDDPISQFIHQFSHRHVVYAFIIFTAALLLLLLCVAHRHKLRIVHFRDIDSIYPTLLCLAVAGAATLYASIQLSSPDVWQQFYYHPTLNPFGQPFVLAAFLVIVWLIVIFALAAADDVRRQLSFVGGIGYLLGLAGVCMACYLFFSLLTPYYYIGYVLLPVYVIFALFRFYKYNRKEYVCGRCGHVIRAKGICPYCGAENE